jgi:Zn-dependent protease
VNAQQNCACGAQVSAALLVCPACGRLVHAQELAALAAEAEKATAESRAQDALTAWRRALELLPPAAPQAEAIRARIEPLSKQVDAAPLRGGAIPKWLAPLGALGLLLWKFKFVLAFVLTKGKLLLLGLTKGSTFFSMILAMGVYLTLWGWKFAVGFVLMIYVHEMGHVAALRRLGIRASAPMFVPGLGAFVRMKQYPASVREDARVGLAGPVWGLAAALACYAAFAVTEAPIFAGLAHAGAVINLFNLIPVWQLDGGRGIRALARRERWLLAALIGGAFLWSGEGMLLLVALAAVWRAFEKAAPAQSDTRAFAEFAGLIVVLGALAAIAVPGVTRS